METEPFLAKINKRYKLTFILYGVDFLIVLLGVMFSTQIVSFFSENSPTPLTIEFYYSVLAIYFFLCSILAFKAYRNLL